MANADACLLDSNILLRMGKGDDPHHQVISSALRALVARGVRLCYTSQTFVPYRLALSRYRARRFGRGEGRRAKREMARSPICPFTRFPPGLSYRVTACELGPMSPVASSRAAKAMRKSKTAFRKFLFADARIVSARSKSVIVARPVS